MTNQPSTVGELRESGYRHRSVKQEMRENLMARLGSGDSLFDGIIGYEGTVFPQIIHAILSRHDMLFLGLRGQAKTRIVRSLPQLLDEQIPVIAGLDFFDDPLAPQFRRTRAMVEDKGERTPIRWVERQERFHEKLATPDVTVADLIGEVDLIKHAEGRYLADEGVMHFGLIPRTNRGIFAINELPDLAPRIQVALFNVLEERDVQIRGFPVRLPLDVCLVFTANPEDYTSRGRIVTPLKDRIGSVIRTHYPDRLETSMKVTRQNAWLDRSDGGRTVDVPEYMLEIAEEVVRLARKSPHINQQSGVSVRASIANVENMVSSAERRAICCAEQRIVPRIADLSHLLPSSRGKIELMLAEDDCSEDKLISSLIGEAVKNVFSRRFDMAELGSIMDGFGNGKTVEVGDDVSAAALIEAGHSVRGLTDLAGKVCREFQRDATDPADLASAMEFVLEALYVNNKLSKYVYRGKTFMKR
jgi:magnesium chelatase subunit I